MGLDNEIAGYLRQLEEVGIRSPHQLSVDDARADLRRRRALARTEPIRMAGVDDRVVAGPGGDLRLRIYRPVAKGPLPILVYLHGGGWVTGDLDTQDFHCRVLAKEATCAVVSVDYRLAPEHKFPAAPEDSYAALEWAAANAASFEGDATRLAVGGASAGGNLAAAVALMARDRSGPQLRLQLLLYPVTNFSFDTPSYQSNAQGYLLGWADMAWYWAHYLRRPQDGLDPYASPLRATDLVGLPPAYIATAEFDPLRDEGEAYALRLRSAGVPVTLVRHAGLIHGFFGMTQAAKAAQAAVDDAARAVTAAFS